MQSLQPGCLYFSITHTFFSILCVIYGMCLLSCPIFSVFSNLVLIIIFSPISVKEKSVSLEDMIHIDHMLDVVITISDQLFPCTMATNWLHDSTVFTGLHLHGGKIINDQQCQRSNCYLTRVSNIILLLDTINFRMAFPPV